MGTGHGVRARCHYPGSVLKYLTITSGSSGYKAWRVNYRSVQEVNRQGVKGEAKTMMLKDQLWQNKLWYCHGDV